MHTIILVRPGNHKHMELTQRGRLDIQELASRLTPMFQAERPLIWSSSMIPAKQTACILADAFTVHPYAQPPGTQVRSLIPMEFETELKEKLKRTDDPGVLILVNQNDTTHHLIQKFFGKDRKAVINSSGVLDEGNAAIYRAEKKTIEIVC